MRVRHGLQVVAALERRELRRGGDVTALPIVVADEEVEIPHGAHRIEAVGVHGRAAVAHDAGTFAVRRELARHLFHHGGLDTRIGGVLLQRSLLDALFQKLEHALHARRQIGGALSGIGESQLAVHQHEARVVGQRLAVRAGLARAPQHLGRDDRPVRQVDGHEVRRIGPGGLAQCGGGLLGGRRQVGRVVALVRDDPRHHGERQLGVLAGNHGQPHVGLRRAAPLARIDHVQLHAALARHRQARSQPRRTLVRRHGLGAPDDKAFAMVDVGVHALMVRRGVRAHVGHDARHAAHAAVVEVVDRAEPQLRQAVSDEEHAVAAGRAEQVGLGAEVGMLHVDQLVGPFRREGVTCFFGA